jgi:hypothetical protein
MSTLIVDNIICDPHLEQVPLTQLGYRIIRISRQNYDGGLWNANTTYNWVPGMNMTYTPARSDTRIRVWCHMPYGRNSGSAHGISHWIFYANGVERGRHSISGQHIEDMSVYVWDMASWGTSAAQLGYQSRSYADDNHEVRPYTTNYFDGGGSTQTCRGQMIVEEYLVGV